MTGPQRKQVWKDSLMAMKRSMMNTYDINTSVNEEEQFVRAWMTSGPQYVVFSDYRRNEGRRRILDIADVIDRAIEQIDVSEDRTASRLYLETLKSVVLCSNWARVLESSVSTTYVR